MNMGWFKAFIGIEVKAKAQQAEDRAQQAEDRATDLQAENDRLRAQLNNQQQQPPPPTTTNP